jgi:hypothetical protein
MGEFWTELPPNPQCDAPCPPPEFEMMAPPNPPIPVHCWHCGMNYSSAKIAWGRKLGMFAGLSGVEPIWWCPTPRCDGGGFRHDIWPDADDYQLRRKELTEEKIALHIEHLRGDLSKAKGARAKFLALEIPWTEQLLAAFSSPKA